MQRRFETFRRGGTGSAGLVHLLSWRGILALAIGGALVIATLVAAAGLFVLLLPLFLIIGFVGRFMLGRKPKEPAARPEHRPVLEGHYEIVEPEEERRARGWERR
jgi:hypothetical protein